MNTFHERKTANISFSDLVKQLVHTVAVSILPPLAVNTVNDR